MGEQSFTTVIGDEDELSVVVYFDYEPAQEEIIYSDNPQPGFAAVAMITDVVVNADSILNAASIVECLNNETLEKLVVGSHEHMESINDL